MLNVLRRVVVVVLLKRTGVLTGVSLEVKNKTKINDNDFTFRLLIPR